jgi:hypothetical protein
MAIAHTIKTGADQQSLYQSILTWAAEMDVEPELLAAI